MADFGAPVAGNVDPNRGLSTISNILGMQRQQQQLQTGVYDQQIAQSQAIQQRQVAKEMQAGAQLMSDPVGNGLTDDKGNPLPGAQQKMQAAMPTTWAAHFHNMLDAAKGKVELASASANLTNDVRSNLASRVAGVAADPNSNTTDIARTLDDIKSDYKDTPAEPYVNQIHSTLLRGMQKVQAEQGPNGVRQMFLGVSRGALGNQGITGPGGVSLPQPATNAAGVTINREPIRGTLSPAPVAGAPPAAAGGGGLGINPSVPAVHAATETQGGGAADDVKRNDEISRSVAPSRQAIALADQISALSEAVRTGKFSKSITDLLGVAGQDDPTLAARQLLSKNAAQLRTLAGANAPTDAARQTVEAGFPDPDHMTPEAIRKSAEYIRGTMQMNLARAANARQFTQTHNGTQGLRMADDQLTNMADPLMYTYQGLKPGTARQDFLTRHFGGDAAKISDFINRKNAVEHYGGFNQ